MPYAKVVAALCLSLILAACTAATVRVGGPEASVRVTVSAYPDLVLVPGYPVYYAPGLHENYFFYNGLFWIYEGDRWYSSYWYNGPWDYVVRDYVPVFILRVPVYYYRRPPAHFRAWRTHEAPRWADYWGEGWARRHAGWSRWNPRDMPAPAPRPEYQRQYYGKHYPRPEQQRELHRRHYQPPAAARDEPGRRQRGWDDQPARRETPAQPGRRQEREHPEREQGPQLWPPERRERNGRELNGPREQEPSSSGPETVWPRRNHRPLEADVRPGQEPPRRGMRSTPNGQAQDVHRDYPERQERAQPWGRQISPRQYAEPDNDAAPREQARPVQERRERPAARKSRSVDSAEEEGRTERRSEREPRESREGRSWKHSP